MKVPKRIVLLTGCWLLMGTSLAFAQSGLAGLEAQRGQLTAKDYRFLEKAARGGIEEIQLGELAQQKGTSQSVRDFGQKMVTDHRRANDELKELAAKKSASLPSRLSTVENYTVGHLQNLSGPDFDQAYAKDMVKDHQKDVKEFQKAVSEITDPDLRAWAQKTLNVLQNHLERAENLEANFKAQK